MTSRPMSNIDKRALREAAEKASTDNHTQDEWFHYLRCSTPETVLALLDELEAKDQRIAEMNESNRLLCADSMIKQERIAELEAREVTLPAQKYCPGEYAGSVLWGETEVWNQAISECAKAIRAAGIGKGD